jgi:hypothetical protein
MVWILDPAAGIKVLEPSHRLRSWAIKRATEIIIQDIEFNIKILPEECESSSGTNSLSGNVRESPASGWFYSIFLGKSPNGIRAHPPKSIGTIKMMVLLMVPASPLELAPS